MKGYTKDDVQRHNDGGKRLFMQPLPPPQEHVVDCPKCGTMVVVPCEDEEDR